jgi:hypothetical protein
VLFIVGFDQLADQRRGGGEAYTMTALTGGQAESQGDVSLARATQARHIVHTFRPMRKFDIGATLPSGNDYEL